MLVKIPFTYDAEIFPIRLAFTFVLAEIDPMPRSLSIDLLQPLNIKVRHATEDIERKSHFNFIDF
jgi:hypothetical protein